jgi:hypothetical protein
MEEITFTLAKNAKRAAERMIDAGTAPSIDYGIRALENGRFEIVWRTGESPTTAEIEEEIAGVADAEPETDPDAWKQTNPWPAGTRVSVAISKKRARAGIVDYRVDRDHWRVVLDGAAGGISNLYKGDQFSTTDTAVPEPKPGRAPPQTGKPSKSSELDATAATGIMPEKPIVTSKANPHYQKRFDFLAERAAAADWPAVEAYEVKGINSYAKMLKQYRDRLLAARLLAAHAAVTASGAV